MMNLEDNFKEILISLYGDDEFKPQLKRYNKVFDIFQKLYSHNDVYLFSTPGRVELSGNHTDHNLGKVLAASISIDSIAIASKNIKNSISIYSVNYDQVYKVDLNDLEKKNEEKESTVALIKGILNRFKSLGYIIGGFDAVIQSNVLPGSGISSSASIEVLFGKILSVIYNRDKISNTELAKIGQWAENNYFGKPCGLMDQIACAVGGIVSIDFKDIIRPKINKINMNFTEHGYSILLIDSGVYHDDLTDDYASIPREMKSIAGYFNKQFLIDVEEEFFYEKIHELRTKFGDRAVLRSIHFYEENKRVDSQIAALQNNNINTFLRLVSESGDSSSKYLQNSYSIRNVSEQGINLCLALTEKFIYKRDIGACRVHGGGFAGTILVIMKNEYVDEYKRYIKRTLGSNFILKMSIRQIGAVCLNEI